MTNQCLETEVLIIGCGIAGGAAALQLADAGAPVTVVTRAREPRESNTFYAQGGVIYHGRSDSPTLLAEDVARAGAGQCNLESVNILARQGPALVQKILLERVGVAFDRMEDETLSLAREGGHSMPRIIHAADATGKAISTALLAALHDHPNVTLLSDYTALDLIVAPRHLRRLAGRRPPRCLGAYLLDRAGGGVARCIAKNTVLATGGLGQLFSRTTNPPGARGDGAAMAHRAGARVADMEYVQFHPTSFYQPGALPFLISEAVRGAGARLVNADGVPFMQKYAPEWRDLAPRDIVARSIYREMRDQGVSHVYLDVGSYVSEPEIRRHFPTIYGHCRRYGLDITRDLVPVAPAAHYACGGVDVDAWGRTSLAGLYAVGEVSCTGVHGANRLASSSLLEGLVWGYRAALQIEKRLPQQARLDPAAIAPYKAPAASLANPAVVDRYMDAIRDLMWRHVGLERTTAGLQDAVRQLRRLSAAIEATFWRYAPDDALVGVRNAVRTALLISVAALNNEKSLGCHYRLAEDSVREKSYQETKVSVPVPVVC